MAEDWSAVAKAINERMTELGVNQRELAGRSRVALSIVREILHNTVQRRRSGRTLEALSVSLGWHPRHLAAVLLGHPPPAPDAPIDLAGDTVPGRLAAIEDHLAEITKRLDELTANLSILVDRQQQHDER